MNDVKPCNQEQCVSGCEGRDEIAVAASAYPREKNYWIEQLSGDWVKSTLRCPYDFPEAEDTAEPGNGVAFRVHGERFDRLMALANRSDARLHMVFTAILSVLLYKHTGNTDIILGMPVYKQDIEGEFVNTALALRNRVDGAMTVKDVLFQVRQTMKDAVAHQNYPIAILAKQVRGMEAGETFPLFDVAILLENIHDKHYLSRLNLGLTISCRRTDASIDVSFEYHPAFYRREWVTRIARRMERLMDSVNHLDLPIAQIEILPDEEKTQLTAFSKGPEIVYPQDKTLPQLFRENALRLPEKEAVAFGNARISYRWLEDNSNHLAGYLVANHIGPGDNVGILIDRSTPAVVAILSVWKAGAAYVPIDPDLPEKRMMAMIDDAGIGMMLSERKYIKTLNRLQWACKGFHTFFCLNSRNIYLEEEAEKSGLMDPKLWEYIGESAKDDIMGGGWIDSYTGQHFDRQVVVDFAENLYQKLKPIINPHTRILEIGCASGIGMYRIAPLVGMYYGTDLSQVIINKNKTRIEDEGHNNILLARLAAHEIDQIEEKDFDVVIINSVIQDFHGHNYLRQVLRKAVDKLGKTGYLFVGDVMDLDLKEAMIEDLVAFKRNNRDKNVKTKIIWEAEQFFAKGFFEDLAFEIPGIQAVTFSDKIFTVENELTKFRYDTLIRVDKTIEGPKTGVKHKHQHGLPDMEKLGPPQPVSRADFNSPAYVIYTSGSTGAPKGAIVEHRGMMNHMWSKIRDFQITEQSVVAQNSPLSFDISVWQMFSALVVGGKTVIYHDEAVLETARFNAHIVEDGVTVLEVVPSYLTLLLDALDIKRADFDRLTFLLVTGETVPPGLLKRWFETYPDIKVANVYGPTEASDDITHYIMDRVPHWDRIPIGTPLPNLRIYIVDNDMNHCPIGVKGEIWVSGIGVGRGYLGDEVKTRAAFITDPFRQNEPGSDSIRLYKTGDLGCWLPDGNIDFFGRKDQQVKIRGFRIELGEIENKLAKLAEVKEVVVIDGGVEKDRRFLCAYVIPDPSVVSDEFDVYELKDYLQGQLPEYMIPQFFVKMEQFPLTANGKIDRKRLPAHDIRVSENYVAPSDDTESKLVDLVAQVLELNRETIGVNDNFFDLGANSINILSLQHHISKTFNYDISISLLFLYPTVRGVAKNIREEEYLNKLECVIKLNDGRNEKNVFMIHPMHGMVYQYKDVAALLKDHYNVYGIQIRGFLTESKLPESIDEMVTDYLQQIKVIQNEGPYIFVGYCFGCVVGYEMIKRLEMAGEKVERFIILDEPAFIPPDRAEALKKLAQAQAPAVPKASDSGSGVPDDPQFTPEIAREVRQLENTILNQEKVPDELLMRLQQKRNFIEQHLMKVEQKVSGIIDTGLNVIKARDNDKPGFEVDLYQRLTHGSVTLDVTEGNHNNMFYPPHTKRLAELIIKNI
ncbi:MAG: amino acid adenylation domain-containing protein [Candidatus Omnitrophota bacterium]